jgi:DNA polymerase-3 subunit gamma/tau
MESFVVSARKYRPATFETVIGQEHITQTLKNAIKGNKLAHAFLFCGPRGVGKTTCARILAKTINCTNLTEDTEACDVCDSCKSFNQNASFNIYELDAASNNSVDDIRALTEQVRYAPQGSRYKIYIIDEVHMLSSAAFNAFLKTLEEPPPYAKFILATTERHKILPTILSRCQVFDFHRIKVEHALTQLKKICANEGVEAQDEALHVIAQKADGAMRDALSIFDRIVSATGKSITYQDVIANLNILDYEYYFKAIDQMIKSDTASLLLLLDDILNNGFDVSHFLAGLNEHLRNLLMCKHPATIALLEVPANVGAKFKSQSDSCSKSWLLNAMNLVNKCEIDLKSHRNPRLHVELYLLKLAHIQSVIDLNAAAADAKKKMIDGQVVAPSNLVSTTTTDAVKPPMPSANPNKPKGTMVSYDNPKSHLDKLNILRNKIASEKPTVEQSEPQVEKVQEQLVEDKPVSNALLAEALKSYVGHLEQHTKLRLSVIYKAAQCSLIGEHHIEIVLGSKHEEEMLEQDRIAFMQHLRNYLQNFKLELTVRVDSKVVHKKIFTTEDKYRSMIQSNPYLAEFRNLFELDLE